MNTTAGSVMKSFNHNLSSHPQRLVAAGVLLLAFTACTPSGAEMNTTAESVAEKAQPEYRKNPQPKQGYRITMTIENAPGPFAHMLGLAQFDVVNRECLPPPKDNPGGHTSPVPTEGVEIPLKRVSDNTWTGVVYADQMLDEDYHGRGVCRWQLIQAQVQLKATGANGETKFIPSFPGKKLLVGDVETVYFNKIGYPGSDSDDFPDTGLNDRSRFGPSIMDEDLFTVTFTSRKE